MQKCAPLMLSLLLLLTACASAPSTPPPVALPLCPALPPLPLMPDPPAAPAPDFMPRMLNFLSGSLPVLTGSKPEPSPAKLPTVLPATP